MSLGVRLFNLFAICFATACILYQGSVVSSQTALIVTQAGYVQDMARHLELRKARIAELEEENQRLKVQLMLARTK